MAAVNKLPDAITRLITKLKVTDRLREGTEIDILQSVVKFATFKAGDKVCIDGDLTKVKKRQEKHGWVQDMEKWIGQEGTVVKLEGLKLEVKFTDATTYWFDVECVHHPEQSRNGNVISTKLVNDAKWQKGEIVLIESDKKKFLDLQKTSGLDTPWIDTFAGARGIVLGVDSEGDVKINTADGRLLIVNANALTHCDDIDEKLEAGDIVYLEPNEKIFKENQKDPGWNADMVKMPGKVFAALAVSDTAATVRDHTGIERKISFKNISIMTRQSELIKEHMENL